MRQVDKVMVCERSDGKFFLLGRAVGRYGYDVVCDPDPSGKVNTYPSKAQAAKAATRISTQQSPHKDPK